MTENPLDFTAWLTAHYGEGYLDLLREKKNSIKKWTPKEKEEMYQYHKAEIERIELLRLAGEEGPIQIRDYD